MPVSTKLRKLFNTADAISIDDTFYRYFNNSASEDGDPEICLKFEDERYEFSSKDLDSATFNDENSNDPYTFNVHCSNTGYNVTLCFHSVSMIKPVILQPK